MKRVKLIAFILVMVIYLAYPVWLISSYESILEGGEVYRFELIPVDPFDAFRGKYIDLRYEGTSANIIGDPGDFSKGSPIYVDIVQDTAGFSKFENAWSQRPDLENYVKTTAISHSEKKVHFKVPFNRYYLPEDYAPVAEEVYNNLTGNRNVEPMQAYVDVRIKNGKSVIEEIYFEGKPILDYLYDVVDE